MAVAFVFPGQGSQSVGMGKALAETFAPARLVFEEVDAALGEELSGIMWNGPGETLTLTENAQPALMAVSLAALRTLEAEAGVEGERRGQPDLVLGVAAEVPAEQGIAVGDGERREPDRDDRLRGATRPGRHLGERA